MGLVTPTSTPQKQSRGSSEGSSRYSRSTHSSSGWAPSSIDDLASAAAAASLQRGGDRLRTVVTGLERLLDMPLSTSVQTPAPDSSSAVASPLAHVSTSGSLLRLLPTSATTAGRLGQAASRLGFEILMAPIALALRGVRNLPQWASGADGTHATSHGDDEGLDTYSLQPSVYASAIGDAALRLVQVCELILT